MLRCPRGRYCDLTMLWLLLFHGIRRGPERDIYRCPGNVNSRRLRAVNRSIICWFSMQFVEYFCWMTSYMIRRNCRMGIVLVVLNKCSGLRPSVALSSLRHGWRATHAGVNNSLLHHLIYHKTSNIRRTLVVTKIVDHSDVVGASPVGAAPTTSSFST